MSQDSRRRNRVPAAKDQGSCKNLVNLGPGMHDDDFVGPGNSVPVHSGPL